MHGFAEMLVFFGFLAAVIIVPQVLKSRDRQRMFDTMRSAYERGQPVPPELVDAMTRPRARDADILDYVPESTANRDLRRGIVWTAIGVGLVVIGLCFYAGLYNDGGAAETLASFAAIGAIPLCVGLAFLGLWWFSRKSARPLPYAPPAPPPPSVAPSASPPRTEL